MSALMSFVRTSVLTQRRYRCWSTSDGQKELFYEERKESYATPDTGKCDMNKKSR